MLTRARTFNMYNIYNSQFLFLKTRDKNDKEILVYVIIANCYFIISNINIIFN